VDGHFGIMVSSLHVLDRKTHRKAETRVPVGLEAMVCFGTAFGSSISRTGFWYHFISHFFMDRFRLRYLCAPNFEPSHQEGRLQLLACTINSSLTSVWFSWQSVMQRKSGQIGPVPLGSHGRWLQPFYLVTDWIAKTQAMLVLGYFVWIFYSLACFTSNCHPQQPDIRWLTSTCLDSFTIPTYAQQSVRMLVLMLSTEVTTPSGKGYFSKRPVVTEIRSRVGWTAYPGTNYERVALVAYPLGTWLWYLRLDNRQWWGYQDR